MSETDTLYLLLAEDDLEDQMLVRRAFEVAEIDHTLSIVNDGEELLDCLQQRPPFEDARLPDLILLDLNMPKKSGRECIEEIKADQRLRRIPIIVLTSSYAGEDIVHSYDNGASSYIRKPVTFNKLVEVVKS
jgi:CheY-like chemotaxis protein